MGVRPTFAVECTAPRLFLFRPVSSLVFFLLHLGYDSMWMYDLLIARAPQKTSADRADTPPGA